MNIGIIGLGVVGKACLKGFKKLGHNCIGIDLVNINELEYCLNADITYLCLPVNFNKKNILNDKLISQYLNYFKKNKYNGILAIKSTIPPGRTNYFKKNFKSLKICFVPEFLRERLAFNDFTKNHELLVVGTNSKKIFNAIKKSHGNYPKKTVMTSEINAELLKIFSNSYNAYRVMFSNIFYELSKSVNGNYDEILDIFLKRKTSTGNYLKCNESLRGFAGTCLPKDLKALNLLLKNKKLNFSTINSVIKDNDKIKKTVFKGMRFI